MIVYFEMSFMILHDQRLLVKFNLLLILRLILLQLLAP